MFNRSTWRELHILQLGTQVIVHGRVKYKQHDSLGRLNLQLKVLQLTYLTSCKAATGVYNMSIGSFGPCTEQE